jgi:hypothetical protein
MKYFIFTLGCLLISFGVVKLGLAWIAYRKGKNSDDD